MSNKGKSVELARLLHGQILNKTWPAGSRLESISGMAGRYQTTVATVSKAFDILEEQGLIERHAGKGCYVREKELCSFALVFDSGSDFEGEFNYKPVFLKNFHRLCQSRDFRYEVFHNIDRAEDCVEVKKKIDKGAFDMVLVGSRYFAEHCKKYLAGSLAVAIGLYSYKWMPATVSISVANVINEGGKDLIQAGCDRIALIYDKRDPGVWSDTHGDFLLENYRDMLRRHGILFDAKLVKGCKLDPQGGYDATLELLNENRAGRLGIISCDALITLGALQAVSFAGRKINEDVSLVSQVNPECPLAKFPLPVISYEAPVAEQIETIFDLIRKHQQDNQPITGHHIISLKRIN